MSPRRVRTEFTIPASIIGSLQAFVGEVCDQSLDNNGGPVVLHIKGTEFDQNGKRQFQVRLVGDMRAVRSAVRLCEAAEEGIFFIPSEGSKDSKPVGTVGVKISIDVELYSVVTMKGGIYGTTYLHRFRDTFGNELVWFTASAKHNKGHYALVGQVKSHGVFDNVMQTKLAYVKLSPLEEDNVENNSKKDRHSRP